VKFTGGDSGRTLGMITTPVADEAITWPSNQSGPDTPK
jgi:hypothetical protein